MPVKGGRGGREKNTIRKVGIAYATAFFAFGVNYMLRINMNIAIVDMVAPITRDQGQFAANQSHQFLAPEKMENSQKIQYNWHESEQSLILGAYFWPLWILQLPGGILAHYYGTKHMIGFNNLLCALLTFFIPFAASLGFRSLFVLRAMQGFIAGAFWPSMPPMVAKWIPPKERGTFVSSYLGSSVGAAFTYSLCGIIIEWYGWQYAFYATGTLGVLWWVAWVTRVYESPQEHPWISKEERDYIEESLQNTFDKKKMPIPWKRILTSRPVLINAITQWGMNGAIFTLLTFTPMYLKYIHNLSTKNNGLWSGIPHLIRWVVAVSFGLATEYQNCLSVTNVRKLATALSTIAVGFVMYGLALFECSTVVAVIIMLVANALQGTVPAGPLANVIDMSPNFSGVIQGCIGIPGTTPGFLLPLLLGYLMENNQTSAPWRTFFFIVSTLSLLCGLLFMFLGTSKVQPWNSETSKEKEVDPLRKEKDQFIMVKIEKGSEKSIKVRVVENETK